MMKSIASMQHGMAARNARTVKWLFVLLLAAVGLSCQVPTQPNPSTIPVTRTVHVRDGNGNDFAGATVSLYAADNSSGIGSQTQQLTGSNGTATFNATVGSGLAWYICVVSASSEYPILRDSIQLGCNDTSLEFTLTKQLTIPCTPITETDSAKCHVCLAPGATDSAFTAWLSFSCATPLAITANSSGATTVMSVEYYTKSPASGPLAAAPATLQPGEQIQARIRYHPTVPSNPTDQFVLTLNFGPTIVYNFKVEGTAENCTSCDCPNSSFTVGLPQRDTACIGTSSDTAIDLSSIHNPGEATCAWNFTLVNDFPDNSEVLIDPGMRNFSLAGGSSLASLPITFSPSQGRLYDETATYSITKVEPDGSRVPCAQTLTVHFQGFGSSPSCTIDPSNLTATVLSLGGTNYNFHACPDESSIKTLTVINPGACPVQNITLSIQNPQGNLWQVSPANIAGIPAHDSVVVTVTFAPSSGDIYGSGDICNPNPLTTTFRNTLIVNGCGNTPASFPLTGYGDPDCHPSASFFLPDYHAKNEGIQIDSGTNVIHVQPKGDTSSWFLYATNLTVSAGTGTGAVTLHGGIIPAASGLKAGALCLFSPSAVGTATSTSGDACQIGCQYKGSCSLSENGASSVIARSGDVFLFTYWTNGQSSSTNGQPNGVAPHCGVIHVGEIHTDANLGYTVADLDICYPIN